MNLGFEFSTTAAKPKRQSDDAPTQVPMRGEGGVRRKPSADQKKVRRQMARQRKSASVPESVQDHEAQPEWETSTASDLCLTCGWPVEKKNGEWQHEAKNPVEWTDRRSTATKESSMSRQREVEILQAMAKADLPEQRRLAQELEDLRATRTAGLQDERDLDLASTVIRDTLTPVAVHERHTAATDWITELPTVVEGSFDNEMRTEATLWFNRLHEAVRADREEFGEQAQGMARRVAGRYGEAAPAAAQTFLDTAARLYTLANEDNGHAESHATDYDTKADQDPLFAEDWEGHDPEGVHPPMPGAGESTGADYHSNGSSLAPATAGPYDSGSFKKCPKCGKNNYAAAGTCAHCGARLKTEDSEHGWKASKTAKRCPACEGGGVFADSLCYVCGGDGQVEGSRTASEGQTCSVCGDKIARDPKGEDNRTWHHDNGETHDHEAKPSGESKESVRKQADGPTHTFPCKDCGATVERYRGEYDVNCPSCGAPHNAGGQRLRDDYAGNPSMYDDEIGDLEGYEMQHAYDASLKTAGEGAYGTGKNSPMSLWWAANDLAADTQDALLRAAVRATANLSLTEDFNDPRWDAAEMLTTLLGAVAVHPQGDELAERIKQAVRTRKTSGLSTTASPKHGDKDVCHADGKPIEFFDGQWMHLSGGPSHNDVYPATPKEKAEKESSLQATASRPLHRIADDIIKEWGVTNINYAARPYLDAMRYLDDINGRFGEDPAWQIVSYFLSNSRSFQGEKAKAIKAELREMVQNRQRSASVEAGGRKGDDFSISDAKNEDGEWTMSPEQIRAEMAASNDAPDPDDFYDDDRYASKQAAGNPNGPKTDDGGAESSLPDVEVGDENDKPMWPWELADGDPATGDGAANVANVPTPGGESGYPQPKKSRRIAVSPGDRARDPYKDKDGTVVKIDGKWEDGGRAHLRGDDGEEWSTTSLMPSKKKSSLDLPIPAQARLADFRARVQAHLAHDDDNR